MTNANVVTWSGRSIYNNRLTGSGTQPVYIGWGISGDTISAFSDINLFEAANPSPEARATGTSSLLSSNQLADTFQVVGTLTALSSKAITEVGLFDTGTSLSAMVSVAVSIASGATSVSISAATTGFPVLPTAGNYYAQMDNEVVLVTGGQGTSTLTITRGALGSTAAGHAIGTFLTAGGDGGAHAANSSIGGETWVPTGANGGSMFVHADFPVINLNTSDSIQFTLQVKLS
jgi:hypothetical protein